MIIVIAMFCVVRWVKFCNTSWQWTSVYEYDMGSNSWVRIQYEVWHYTNWKSSRNIGFMCALDMPPSVWHVARGYLVRLLLLLLLYIRGTYCVFFFQHVYIKLTNIHEVHNIVCHMALFELWKLNVFWPSGVWYVCVLCFFIDRLISHLLLTQAPYVRVCVVCLCLFCVVLRYETWTPKVSLWRRAVANHVRRVCVRIILVILRIPPNGRRLKFLVCGVAVFLQARGGGRGLWQQSVTTILNTMS